MKVNELIDVSVSSVSDVFLPFSAYEKFAPKKAALLKKRFPNVEIVEIYKNVAYACIVDRHGDVQRLA